MDLSRKKWRKTNRKNICIFAESWYALKNEVFANIVCSKRNCAHLALFSKCALCDVYIYLCRIRLPLPGVRNPQLKSARYLRPPPPPPPTRANPYRTVSRSFFPIYLSCRGLLRRKEMERKMLMTKKEEDEKTMTFILMWIIFHHAISRYTADRALEKVS
jgi:hypothetical protein